MWLCHEGLALSRNTFAKRWDYCFETSRESRKLDCNAQTWTDAGINFTPELEEGAHRGN